LHPPEAIGWWPPAPGWWLVALLLVALIVGCVRLILRYARGNRYRMLALRELEDLYAICRAGGEEHAFAAGANRLLRRAALAHYPRADVASLCDEAWTAFLNRAVDRDLFHAEQALALTRSAYDPNCPCNSEQLFQACRDWLRHHR